jgi:hypothetical protein
MLIGSVHYFSCQGESVLYFLALENVPQRLTRCSHWTVDEKSRLPFKGPIGVWERKRRMQLPDLCSILPPAFREASVLHSSPQPSRIPRIALEVWPISSWKGTILVRTQYAYFTCPSCWYKTRTSQRTYQILFIFFFFKWLQSTEQLFIEFFFLYIENWYHRINKKS